jgi:hypothetical protein
LNFGDFKIETGQAVAVPVLLDMGLYLFVAVVFGIGIAHKTNRSFTLYKEERVIGGRLICHFALWSVGSFGVFCFLVCRDHPYFGVMPWRSSKARGTIM